MLIDSNTIFFDSVALTEINSGKESDPVGLTSFLRPGQEEAIPVRVTLSSDTAPTTGATLQLVVYQSDTKDGDYKNVDGTELKLDQLEGTGVLEPGRDIGWRFLPRHITKPWIKIKATGTGFTAGTIFAAVVREDFLDYEDGMYIDKGRAVC